MAPDFGVGGDGVGYVCRKPVKDAALTERLSGVDLERRGYVAIIGNFPLSELPKRLEEADSDHRPTQVVVDLNAGSGRATIYIPNEDYRERGGSSK
jgi:hypothetical protein